MLEITGLLSSQVDMLKVVSSVEYTQHFSRKYTFFKRSCPALLAHKHTTHHKNEKGLSTLTIQILVFGMFKKNNKTKKIEQKI